ncbi:MAG: GtrA family protein [Rikenellaceae bacterium]|nr:GtrA family protein [Rikenellaceae bacterium]MDE7356260.1 GtrA family protein [Rikenellaceae bacterium]
MALSEMIIGAIDRFYPSFMERFMSRQMFRYGVCGGSNMLLDMVLYFLFYQLLYRKECLHIGAVTISAEIAAFLTVFPITFFTGLWLAKNVSFRNSTLKNVTQGGRYFMVVLLNIGVKYFGLKLLVEVLGWFPSVSNAVLTILTVLISYLLQKNFSFRGHSE